MDKDIIWRAQVSAVKGLELSLKSLIKSANETLERVRSGGIEHNYSCNHDCYDYAAKVWKYSLRLSELKKLEHEVNGLDQWGMPKKEKRKKKPVAKTKKTKKGKNK